MDVLKELQDAFLAANFEEAKKASERIKWKDVVEAAQKESVDHMRACSIGAEVLDHFGHPEEVVERLRPLVVPAEKRLRALVDEGRGVPRSGAERRVVKQWVWILLQLAMADYRANRLDVAMARYRLCESAILRIQDLSTYTGFLSLSRVHYGIGLIYRERFDYTSAKRSFVRCIEFVWRSLFDTVDESQGTFKHSALADVTLARALGIGLGFVYHADGQPDLALPVLLSAKNLLSRLGETLLHTYVDLVYFDARRSAYGADSSIVDDAIKGLERCHDVFVTHKHELYRARSAFSLALAYAQRARPDEAQSLTAAGEDDLKRAAGYATELKLYAQETTAQRARLYAMLCMSRIERKRDNLTKAEELATEAIASGGDANNHIHTSLLIARAEAYVRLGKIGLALDDFNAALKLAEGSVRSRAICLLRLTDILAREGQSTLAAECFEEWRQIRSQMSNAHLGQLEQTARIALEKASQDFIVRLTDNNVDPQELEKRLRGFLVQWATHRSKTDVEAARMLGVSRQTLLNWKSDKSTRPRSRSRTR